jgi:20S proteasome alpha/beta subunit
VADAQEWQVKNARISNDPTTLIEVVSQFQFALGETAESQLFEGSRKNLWVAPKLDRDSQLRAFAPTLRRKFGTLGGSSLTVCIAAVANHNELFVAADRMRTAGDIQYEPESPKIIQLTNSMVLMTAGDSQLNREIVGGVRRAVSAQIQAEPNEWVSVRDVVDWYVWYLQENKRKAAEAAILRPLGLNSQTFLSKQREMNADVVQELTRTLINYPVPTTHVIVAGIDANGTHIYTVREGVVAYHNAVGFAAIGSGYWHVESEFTLSGHHSGRSIPETISLVYRAKRRAETAPGVGQATDMGMMIGGPGSYMQVGDHIQEKLSALYDKMAKQQERARNQVHKELASYVRSLQQTPQIPAEQESDGRDGLVVDPEARDDPTDVESEGQSDTSPGKSAGGEES